MKRPRIFISYRREDSSGHAGRLYDALADRFGSENVFIDVDTIQIGSDFAETIEHAVGGCDALVALIGRDWTTAALPGGERRLEDSNDFVRIELETALAHDIAVIPVAVRGAVFPGANELPASLEPLTRRQGIELRDSAWRDDVNRLIRRLESLTRATPNGAQPAPTRRRSRRSTAIALGVVFAAAVAGISFWLTEGSSRSSTTSSFAQEQAAATRVYNSWLNKSLQALPSSAASEAAKSTLAKVPVQPVTPDPLTASDCYPASGGAQCYFHYPGLNIFLNFEVIRYPKGARVNSVSCFTEQPPAPKAGGITACARIITHH